MCISNGLKKREGEGLRSEKPTGSKYMAARGRARDR